MPVKVVTFPPREGWEVMDDQHFPTFQPWWPDLALLVQVSPEGGYSGCFRLALRGNQTFKCQMGADRLLAGLEAANYNLTIQIRAEELSFRDNSITSDWFDADQRDR